MVVLAQFCAGLCAECCGWRVVRCGMGPALAAWRRRVDRQRFHQGSLLGHRGGGVAAADRVAELGPACQGRAVRLDLAGLRQVEERLRRLGAGIAAGE